MTFLCTLGMLLAGHINNAAAAPAQQAGPSFPPCPAIVCKGHLGRTYCPGKPEQCQVPTHEPCPPCTPTHSGILACQPPHDSFPFCDTKMSVPDRIRDLISRIDDADKPSLLTARSANSSLPDLGVPAYYWGTNCIHSISDLATCVRDSQNVTRCPTNFPSGPSFGATFDRSLIQAMASVVGTELRAVFRLGTEAIAGGSAIGLDCWGPVLNLARDPRCAIISLCSLPLFYHVCGSQRDPDPRWPAGCDRGQKRGGWH